VNSILQFTCRANSRYISSDIRRVVRQRSRFGCCVCGCPIIEYHHITPYSEGGEHTVENLIALCPTCHKRADKEGSWSVDQVRKFGDSPYNTDTTKDRFLIDSSDFVVRLGWIEFRNCSQLVALGKRIVLESRRMDDGIILVSGYFQDEEGNPIAKIVENEWRILTDSVWDVEFLNASRLTVRVGPGRVALKMRITGNVLEVQQCFFRDSHARLFLRGDDKSTNMKIEASGNTRFRSRNERIVIEGPFGAPALILN